jgi:hypothetical protein
MGQKPVDVRRVKAHLTVIPVVSVPGSAEYTSRKRRWHFSRAAPKQKRIRPAAGVLGVIGNDLDRVFFGTGDE